MDQSFSLITYLCLSVIYISASIPVSHFVSLSIYLSIYLSISLSLSISLTVYLSVCLCLCLFVCLSVSVFVSLYLSILLSLPLSYSLSLSLSLLSSLLNFTRHDYLLLLFLKERLKNLGVIFTTNSSLSLCVAVGMPVICAFNKIAQGLKSGLSSSLKVDLHCAYQPLKLSLG